MCERFESGTRVSVLVPRDVGGCLDYLVPEGGVRIGQLVEVPLGPSRELGLVWGRGTHEVEAAKLRPILKELDAAPINRPMRDFMQKVGDYTLTPLNMMMRMVTRVPKLRESRPRGIVLRPTEKIPDKLTPARQRVLQQFKDAGGMPMMSAEIKELAQVSSSVLNGLVKSGSLVSESILIDERYPFLDPERPGFQLSAAQAHAAQELRNRVRNNCFSTVLLKGVTGAGKTEVYLEAVSEALRAGRQVLVLLPEIALTSQFMRRVGDRFGALPAEWHSEIKPKERMRLWRAAGDGTVQLVVGARSALFLPFCNLGLIVVDEEHDTSFKQDDGVHYHARDMAVLRASLSAAHIVLASATPSLESWENARRGKYHRVDLPDRVGTAELPEMMTIDLRAAEMGHGCWISSALTHAVREALAKEQQSLLFLNRRGYAPLTVCRSCGFQLGCPDCDARLVEHRFSQRLMCHLCGYSTRLPDTCPNCGADDQWSAVGPGIERLAQEAQQLFPNARIETLSSDYRVSMTDFRRRLESIRKGEIDIIIGTQIIAKGHNFPRLTLVGAIDADLGLHGTDLRAAERTFQMMTQVAGRAGRRGQGQRGVAFLQTWQPDHPVMQAIVSGDDEQFWAVEAAERQVAGVPPFGRFAVIKLSGPVLADIERLCRMMVRQAQPLQQIGAQLFGPAPAQVARVRGRHQFRFLIKAERRVPLQLALMQWRSQFQIPTNIRLVIDIDPQSFM